MAKLENVSEKLENVSGGSSEIDFRIPFEELKKKLLAPFPEFEENLKSSKEELAKRREALLTHWMEKNKEFCKNNEQMVSSLMKLIKFPIEK